MMQYINVSGPTLQSRTLPAPSLATGQAERPAGGVQAGRGLHARVGHKEGITTLETLLRL